MLSDATIGEFKKSLRGELILRNDPRYEEARKLYNGMIDKRPLFTKTSENSDTCD